MGQHDPLDGLITYRQLQAAAKRDEISTAGRDLESEIADMVQMCEGMTWDTDDPLGIGGLLCDAHRGAQLSAVLGVEENDLLVDPAGIFPAGPGAFCSGSLAHVPCGMTASLSGELGHWSIGLRARCKDCKR